MTRGIEKAEARVSRRDQEPVVDAGLPSEAGVAGRGGMVSLSLPADATVARLQRCDGRLGIAAVNNGMTDLDARLRSPARNAAILKLRDRLEMAFPPGAGADDGLGDPGVGSVGAGMDGSGAGASETGT